MKATTKEEAERAWALYIDRKAGHVNPMQPARETFSDFKSALRAEIEKDLSTVKESDSNYIVFKSFADKFLNLLETTLPPKE